MRNNGSIIASMTAQKWRLFWPSSVYSTHFYSTYSQRITFYSRWSFRLPSRSYISGFQNTVFQIFLTLLMSANIAITKLIVSIFLVTLAKYTNCFVPHFLTFLLSCYFLSHFFKYYCLQHVLEKTHGQYTYQPIKSWRHTIQHTLLNNLLHYVNMTHIFGLWNFLPFVSLILALARSRWRLKNFSILAQTLFLFSQVRLESDLESLTRI